jgi:unsaturated rhamnogalacturonyl hydrolase
MYRLYPGVFMKNPVALPVVRGFAAKVNAIPCRGQRYPARLIQPFAIATKFFPPAAALTSPRHGNRLDLEHRYFHQAFLCRISANGYPVPIKGRASMPRLKLTAGCFSFFLLLGSFSAAAEKPRVWAEKMADSEMQRRGESLAFGKDARVKWAYETGVFLSGLDAVSSLTGNTRYYDYLKTTMDSYIEPDGAIKTYKLEDYNIDNINNGKLLLSLFQKTGDEKYRKAAALLIKQLETHPRTREGGFWHKKIYPWQMWLDGIYMGSPFYARYSQMFGRPEAFNDIRNQVVWMESHARDAKTGLLYHGWDESRSQEWADPATGCSKNFWGRAMGWYAMAIVDILDYMPREHPGRPDLIAVFQRLMKAVSAYQDTDSGLWYQVVDQGKRPGNYLEASASSMFVYALAKGVRLGYIDKSRSETARKGFEGLVTRLVKKEPGGGISLTQICSVAGLGGPAKRSGTFEYYIGEPIVENDLKGVGAFILAAAEWDKLMNPAR